MFLNNIKDIARKIIPYDLQCAMKRPEISRSVPPLVFNDSGELCHWAYLQAKGSNHHPYMLCDGPMPHRVIWDRFNYALNTHFYCEEDIFHTRPYGTHHLARLAEAEVIIPNVWKDIRLQKEYIEKEFDFFFTHSADLLETFSNAKFCPAGAVWYGSRQWGGNLEESVVKTKNVSIVSSNKVSCPLHVFRLELAKRLLSYQGVDVFGTVVGRYAKPVEIFKDYRYSIAIENEISPYWFTEKITNCFASKTVPIYIGASKIGDFFNEDGMIIIKEPTIEAVEKALKQCSQEDYNSRKEAIDDNFNRVKGFLCPEDYLYNHYPKIFE